MADKNLGTVSHYYDKIGVAVIKLKDGDLKIGDEVKLIGNDGVEFTQEIKSMQIEHADIEIAKKGDEFGIKTEKPVKSPSPLLSA
jgi:putative protease